MEFEPSNLKQYLPNYYDGVLETDVLMDVENSLFDIVKKNMQDVLNNQFVLTCDVQMLYHYEQILNIRPDTVLETIAFRRMRVLNRMNSRQPFTYWFYRQALDTMFGRNNSTLIVDHNNHLINIDIATWDIPAYDEFINHLRITKPASLLLNLKLTHEFPKFTANHASATISGESVLMGPRVITDVHVTGNKYYGSATVSGEAVTMSPRIKTDIGVSGGHHYGAATVSGECVTSSPSITTDVGVSGVYYQGLAMISGEVVTISPPISTAIESTGQSYQGTAMLSGELVELSPQIITDLKSSGKFSKSQITVTGEKIEVYPKGVK